MSDQARTVLVTGGAGFIGTHVTRMALERGHRVRILDNLSPQIHGEGAQFRPPDGAEFYRGDVRSRADWEIAVDDVDSVIHLAAETGTGQSMYEIDRYYQVNVQGTAILFDILANKPHRLRNVVLASSRSVYGEGAYLCRTCAPEGLRRYPAPRSKHQLEAHHWTPTCPVCGDDIESVATREDDELAPASIYAATKLAQEQLVAIASRSLGIAHAILRFQNVFGEGQSLANPYTGILSIFSTRIRLGLPLPIFEDGRESRDFIHVEDIAAAVLACVERPVTEGRTVNVGSGVPTSVMEVAQLLCRIMRSDIQPHVTGEYRLGDIRHNFADIARLEQEIGLSPQLSLESGMRRFCDWVQRQPIPEDLLDKANEELRARNLMG